MTKPELEAALASLFPGVVLDPVGAKADGRVGTFLHNASGNIDESQLADFRDVAQRAARRVSQAAPPVHGCAGTGTVLRACVENYVTDLARRAFRRPLAPEESQRLSTLWSAGFDAGGAEGGLLYVVEALVQAPSFIYLHERVVPGMPFALDTDEIAQRMAFMLARGPPDAELAAAADNHSLVDANVRIQHARRILATQGALTPRNFVMQWLGLDLVTPEYLATFGATPATRARLVPETLHLIDHVMNEQGAAWPELLRAPYTFVDQTLEEHYGIAASLTSGWRKHTDANWHAGLLTQGTFLAEAPDPVHRGLTIRNSVLCGEVPGPPFDPSTVFQSQPGESERSKAGRRLAQAPCGGCHQLMDPIGLVFDTYDVLGRRRDQDQYGNPVRSDGAIFGTMAVDGPVSSAAELGRRLGEAAEVRQCVARQLFMWTYARKPRATDACHLEHLEQALIASNDSLTEAMVALVAEPAFVTGYVAGLTQ